VAIWSLSEPRVRAARALDLRSVDCPECRDLLEQFTRADIDVSVWDITTDIGLPAFLCLVADRDSGATDPEVGSGCHASRSVALMRALSEAAQTRATWISGSRDDFDPLDYQASSRARRLATGRDWLAAHASASFRNVPTLDNGCIRDDLSQAVTLLARAGAPQILVVDLTHPRIGVPVARVVIPGLEGVYQSPAYAPGARGERMQARRG
jgi:YcaO-like protein with predicted kinase domain